MEVAAEDLSGGAAIIPRQSLSLPAVTAFELAPRPTLEDVAEGQGGDVLQGIIGGLTGQPVKPQSPVQQQPAVVPAPGPVPVQQQAEPVQPAPQPAPQKQKEVKPEDVFKDVLQGVLQGR